MPVSPDFESSDESPRPPYRLVDCNIRIVDTDENGFGGRAIFECTLELNGARYPLTEWLNEDGTLHDPGEALANELADADSRRAIAASASMGMKARRIIANEVARIVAGRPELLARISKTFH